jgi:hypothetical protein
MMLQRFSPKLRFAAAMLAAASIALFAGTAAQAQPSYAVHQDKIVGIVRSFDGAYTMYVRDEHGYLDRVELHQGTIINPTGLTLGGGMHVTVYGHPEGPIFVADEIDTPYHHVPGYYGYPYGDPYGYPYGYPYPAWGIGVRFGGWHHHCC